MEFTNNQIKCILRIKELLETSNVLSKLYKEYDDKELSMLNITDQERFYKVYCSSIYNLIKIMSQIEKNQNQNKSKSQKDLIFR